MYKRQQNPNQHMQLTNQNWTEQHDELLTTISQMQLQHQKLQLLPSDEMCTVPPSNCYIQNDQPSSTRQMHADSSIEKCISITRLKSTNSIKSTLQSTEALYQQQLQQHKCVHEYNYRSNRVYHRETTMQSPHKYIHMYIHTYTPIQEAQLQVNSFNKAKVRWSE